MSLRRRVFEIIDASRPGDPASRVFAVFMVTLIGLNVAAIVLATVKPVNERLGPFFAVFEIASVILFSAEYLLRLWTCTLRPEFASPISGRARFALRPMMLIDLLSVLPFYLPFVGLDLRFIRSVRMFRLLRLGKLGRYSKALQTLGRVVSTAMEELIIAFFVLLLLLVLASSLMYFAEHEAQPEAFPNIPAAMWWAVTTVTTVGYGDICPVTPQGKVLASVVAVLGIVTFAMPTAILGAAFLEQVQKRKRQAPRICPHCGKEIEPPS